MNSNTIAVLFHGLPGLTFADVCTDIEDDKARLACYDALNRDSAPAAAEVTQPEPSPQGVEQGDLPDHATEGAAVVEAGSPDEFGVREPPDGPKEYIEATIVKIDSADGRVDYLQLDNGQVWREIGDSRLRFKEGRRVTISEGILNSYDLKMEGYNKVVKVKRVR
jgi:hypothetical protein